MRQNGRGGASIGSLNPQPQYQVPEQVVGGNGGAGYGNNSNNNQEVGNRNMSLPNLSKAPPAIVNNYQGQGPGGNNKKGGPSVPNSARDRD